MAIDSLNDMLQEVDRRGIKCVKIASGYYLSNAKTYVLCKCDGNSTLVKFECECGADVIACIACLESGLIRNCPKCASVYSQIRREAAKAFGLPWEEIEARILEGRRLRVMPIDFKALIAQGKLERLSATKFRLLVPFHDLPEHVRKQIVDIEQTTVDGKLKDTIVRFSRRKRPKR